MQRLFERLLFLKTALLTLVISSIAIAQERPNILLVVADDLGWSDIGAYGSEIQDA